MIDDDDDDPKASMSNSALWEQDDACLEGHRMLIQILLPDGTRLGRSSPRGAQHRTRQGMDDCCLFWTSDPVELLLLIHSTQGKGHSHAIHFLVHLVFLVAFFVLLRRKQLPGHFASHILVPPPVVRRATDVKITERDSHSTGDLDIRLSTSANVEIGL